MYRNALYILLITFIAWFITQTIKLIGIAISKNKISFEMYLATGGMPSSHSAIVSSLSIGMGMLYGFNSPYFVISIIYAVIVMHDAVKVRSAISNNTKTMKNFLADIIENEYIKKSYKLNMLEKGFKQNPDDNYERNLKQIKKMKREIDDLKKLKVVLGHTLSEVLIGAIIGGLISFLYFYLT